MCGRFTLHTEKELLARRFRVDLDGIGELPPRYNIAPSQSVLTMRREHERRIASLMRWGLVPEWVQPLARLPQMINARAESVATRPAYRRSFQNRRCLVVADGFYEWQARTGPRGTKTPYWISLKTEEPFGMAAIWASLRARDEPGAEPLVSCAIVTAPANAAVQSIHNRMPVILSPGTAEAWLDPALDGKVDRLLQLLVPVPAQALAVRPVSQRVNSPEVDDAELIARADVAAPTLF